MGRLTSFHLQANPRICAEVLQLFRFSPTTRIRLIVRVYNPDFQWVPSDVALFTAWHDLVAIPTKSIQHLTVGDQGSPWLQATSNVDGANCDSAGNPMFYFELILPQAPFLPERIVRAFKSLPLYALRTLHYNLSVPLRPTDWAEMLEDAQALVATHINHFALSFIDYLAQSRGAGIVLPELRTLTINTFALRDVAAGFGQHTPLGIRAARGTRLETLYVQGRTEGTDAEAFIGSVENDVGRVVRCGAVTQNQFHVRHD
ncbi:hypothetical protein EW146_g7770 [Bondarzewia mesenterica]|uniref:Uncharacterized protein n=1 Tax=Bondarzewia mesenterica TaxID=1095465 RepID=A0A4S4LJN0_9AGAM|nr:hypothetical protein EW146_g7770 [Bondarzewia mesenterica]